MCKHKFAFLSKQRIHNKAEFALIFKQGKCFTEGCFVLHALNKKTHTPRLGIVLSKRYVSLAVKRNYIRRMIRERFRLMQHQLNGLDVVISLRSSIGKIIKKEQALCIEKLFSQLVRYCDGAS